MITAYSAPDAAFWRGRRVLVTGHTGFMGGWLAVWLHRLGAEVSGLALPATKPSFYEAVAVSSLLKREFLGDVRDAKTVATSITEAKPDIVFHLAAQPLVGTAFVNPVGTFQTNVLGTVHVLDALRTSAETRAVLVVTSDKVYENAEPGAVFSESDRLGGKEPYSSSKACTELVVDCYRGAYLNDLGIRVATIRAGNVIGGGDWAENRLIPDLIRAFSKHQPLTLRNPDAVRPWQHVIEPLRGYLLLAERMIRSRNSSFDGSWNFGPRHEDHKTVAWIVDQCAAHWGGNPCWTISSEERFPEAKRLVLSSEKSRTQLGWEPRLDLDAALRQTIAWYKSYLRGAPMLNVTWKDIEEICPLGASAHAAQSR